MQNTGNQAAGQGTISFGLLTLELVGGQGLGIKMSVFKFSF